LTVIGNNLISSKSAALFIDIAHVLDFLCAPEDEEREREN
jgi:hypothetical protein